MPCHGACDDIRPMSEKDFLFDHRLWMEIRAMPGHPEAKRFETRREMLSLVPQRGVVAEIGVFEGQFSKDIFDVCRPRELVLIDIWAPGPMVSADVDGHNRRVYDGADLEKTTRARMESLDGVRIVKSPSSVLETFPEGSFDMIYIDADHSYEGVMVDLANAAKVIKDGGLIMGHDYDHNPAKNTKEYPFGVRRAVDEFCQMHGQAIEAVGMDGCVSYAIRYRKGGSFRPLRVRTVTRLLRAKRFLARCTPQGFVRLVRRKLGLPPNRV